MMINVSWASGYDIERPETINDPSVNITDDTPQQIFAMYIETH